VALHTGCLTMIRASAGWLAEKLPGSAGNVAAVRLFGTQLLPIRIDLDS